MLCAFDCEQVWPAWLPIPKVAGGPFNQTEGDIIWDRLEKRPGHGFGLVIMHPQIVPQVPADIKAIVVLVKKRPALFQQGEPSAEVVLLAAEELF